MSLVQLRVMTPEEQAEANAAQLLENKAKARLALAKKNRAAGISEPQPGDQLFVMSAKGIKLRSRAGITFSDSKRSTVVVVDAPEHETIEGKADAPGDSVTVHGAEMILADDGLTVGTRSATEVDASQLRAELQAKEAELEQAHAELRRLRDARRDAKDTGTGAPSRLPAARRAVKPDPEGFGGSGE